MVLFSLKKNCEEQQVEHSYMALRQVIGILGMFLPFAVVFFAAVFGSEECLPQNCFSTISATYHTNAGPIMVGLLFCVGLFLVTYDGYDRQDSIVSTISGIAAMGIAFFPCTLKVLSIDSAGHSLGTRVGIFHLPIEVSNIIHLALAAAFFLLLAYNSFFLFTKTKNKDSMSNEKKKRNLLYKICGLIIFASIICILVINLLYTFLFSANPPDFYAFEYTPYGIVFETIMLIAFGLSWLAKGGAIMRDIDARDSVTK
ncbi:MAG TPA: hypothetical protein PLG87_05800 [Treponemataceae bacterium]|jgi:uncharacterized membrane protein YqhA|nr:hypothetical protein [Treponemataceae bacterium]